MIVAVAGLPRTGKSTLARNLAKRLPGLLLDKIAVRDHLFPGERSAASRAQNDWSFEVVLTAAAWNLEGTPGGVVVLDGPPLTRGQDVRALNGFASGIGQPLKVIECVCPTEIALGRGRGESGPTPASFDILMPRREPIPDPKIVVDTTLSKDRCLALALQGLRGADVGAQASAGLTGQFG
ncbi:AAA family ATPase [Streptomyces peucetius]|uniref:ATP-binding protein n=1 Tax=Streptomyces peucetius TaxID=1950 RepID=A0ABY6HZU4_STRPE|nr:ATP-binding protein [Streptomyces peucetius]UYQ60039.1 ATP-binding protein [Streptomyces peucetius]